MILHAGLDEVRPIAASCREKMDPSPGSAPLVLIVDDFDDNRQMYAEYLKYCGFRVVEASDGAEAVATAIAAMPDIVVMDLSLPVLDGWQATRQLKGDPRTQHIPVVALTGHALEGHSQDARNAGCDAFLAKPCLPEKLLETIQRMLPAPKAPVEKHAAASGPPEET